MARARRLPKTVLAALDTGKILGLRAGSRPHRFIGVWVVVVEGRVFARSWSVKPDGWHRTFRAEPRGAIQAAGRTLRVRAAFPRSARLLDAIDRAYAAKYHTPWSRKYVRDLCRARSRATTTEFVPLQPLRA